MRFGTCGIGEQWRPWTACTIVECHQSLPSSQTQSMEVDDDSDKILDMSPHWVAAHECLKNDFTHMR